MSLVAAKYSATKIFLHIDENVYSAAKNLTPVILSDVEGACDRDESKDPENISLTMLRQGVLTNHVPFLNWLASLLDVISQKPATSS
jgi:hypothetical protein